MIPFNIELLQLSDADAKLMKPVKVLDIFQGAQGSRNFHPEGLFSIDIFGRIGDEKRNKTYSYIDLKVSVFHPLIFEILGKLKGLYHDIILGNGYAIWDNAIKDFVKSTPTKGSTGMSFFLEHFNSINFEETDSTKREFNIKLINKYKDKLLINKILVMPAGLRDFEFDEAGKPSEDEINNLYRKVIAISNLIEAHNKGYNTDAFDNIRALLQTNIYELYEYIKSLLEGKHKLILGKWATRRVQNGTRNVITTVHNNTDVLNSPLTVGYNQTVVGLFQYLKATLPISIYNLRSGFLTKVFSGANSPAILVDMKTLRKKMVNVDPESFDDWMTSEGLEKVINRYGEEDLRHMPIIIEGYYLGLIYKGPEYNGCYKLFQDIDELPKDFDSKYIYPITLTELLYTAVYEKSSELYGFFTRYPITGYGSIYPCGIYLKTTVPSEVRLELDDSWHPGTKTAYQFPIVDAQFVNSMSPAPSHLALLGADFDGDTGSLTIVFTDESTEEVKKKLASRDYYVNPNNTMNFSGNTDIIEYVLANMTA